MTPRACSSQQSWQLWWASRNFFSDTSNGEPSIIADGVSMKTSRSLKSIQPLATVPWSVVIRDNEYA